MNRQSLAEKLANALLERYFKYFLMSTINIDEETFKAARNQIQKIIEEKLEEIEKEKSNSKPKPITWAGEEIKKEPWPQQEPGIDY